MKIEDSYGSAQASEFARDLKPDTAGAARYHASDALEALRGQRVGFKNVRLRRRHRTAWKKGRWILGNPAEELRGMEKCLT